MLKGIRVKDAAPGPIWTPIIPASFPPKDVSSIGTDVPLGRAGQSEETAPKLRFPRFGLFLIHDRSNTAT